MPKDKRDLLEILKGEMEFVQKGGYDSTPGKFWRPRYVFEDSPSCLNANLPEKRVPCSECVLIELVPPERRREKVPCRHIPLKETGETVDYFYRTGTRQELEQALIGWLQKTILRLEERKAQQNVPPVE